MKFKGFWTKILYVWKNHNFLNGLDLIPFIFIPKTEKIALESVDWSWFIIELNIQNELCEFFVSVSRIDIIMNKVTISIMLLF